MISGKNYCVTTKKRSSTLYGMTDYVAVNKHKGLSRFPRSVVSVDEQDLRNDTLNGRIKSRIHPTQKPLALLTWLILTYTKEGDTILDPVAGSMTAAIAAMRTGRRAICIEKDAGYFNAGVHRVWAESARLRREQRIV